ncbi:MAG: thiamine ABC transporter substrate-binding protein [Spirochaetaceae bacterium]|nr:thiamine ABC transporter substrate-binding protein [Spirochaetaceae bacterium]
MKHFHQDKGSLVMRFAVAALILCSALLATSCSEGKTSTLVVWTYDSFISEWGPGPGLAKLYEEKTGIKVVFQSKGDGGALLAELLAKGKNTDADIVIGLDDRTAQRGLDSGLFTPLHLSNIAKIDKSLIVDPTGRLVPYDYGNFAFIWDSNSDTKPPESLEDLTKPEYKKKVIIMDPRTSTPGLGLLAWSEAIYGNSWKDYWKRLAPSLLTMTPGWDTGYGLFTKGEAPLVLSYSTSPAYHKAYENSERYKALVFKEGHSAQIELAGVLAHSKNRKAAEKFIDFLLSEEAQAMLPETQWMYPVNSATKLPDSFKVIPEGIRTIPATIAKPESDPEAAVEALQEALQ